MNSDGARARPWAMVVLCTMRSLAHGPLTPGACHWRAGRAGGSSGVTDLALPCAPAEALLSVARLCATFPALACADALPRVLPHAHDTSELASLLKKFDLSPWPSAAGGGASDVLHVAGYRLLDVRPSEASIESADRHAIADWAPTPAAAGESPTLQTLLPCGEGPLTPLGSCEGHTGVNGALSDLPLQAEVVTALVQDHAIGMDMCLIGRKGSGKTAISRRFAATLGYRPRTVYCYADLPARDLLQRRSTDASGSTMWVDADVVRAAIDGELLILDNVHRLPLGTLAASLGRLITDRELQLPDGRRLLPREAYDALHAAGTLGVDEAAQLVPVHPAFRILATADTPIAWGGDGDGTAGGAGGGAGGWLGSELLSLFHFHRVPELSGADHATLVAALHSARRHVAAASASANHGQLRNEPGELAEGTALKLLALREALEAADAPAALHGLRLTTRGLLRAASHAGSPATLAATTSPAAAAAAAEQHAAHAAWREIAGARGSLTDGAASALSALLSRLGLPSSPPRHHAEGGAAAGADLPPPTRTADPAHDGCEVVAIGPDCRIDGIVPPAREELVPEVVYFDSARHTAVLREMLVDFAAGNHLLLIGSQGVGKNKLADRMLQLLRRGREYMQLHRDVTVGSLTQTPNLVNGQLVWEDSPLVRALEHGRVLMLDEADKAPLEVTCILRSLLAEGAMVLADGRRVAPVGTPPSAGVLPIAPGFRAIVLANKPGFPFLGNDFFRECGDVLSCHTVFNPDLLSEVQLLRQYGPDVSEGLLRRVASVFADLRELSAGGEIAYPFSTREAVSLVKHVQVPSFLPQCALECL